MIRRIKRFFAAYSKDFWIYVIFIAILTALMYYVSGTAVMRATRSSNTDIRDSDKDAAILSYIKNSTDIQTAVMQDFLNDGAIDGFYANKYVPSLITRINSGFEGTEDIALLHFSVGFTDGKPGVVLNIISDNPLFPYLSNDDMDFIYAKAMSIRGSFWEEANNSGSPSTALLLVEPLFQGNELYFVTGIVIDIGKLNASAPIADRPSPHIFIFALSAILCVFLIQTNLRHNASPFSWLSIKTGEKFASGFSKIRLIVYQSNILILAALFVVFMLYAAYKFISNSPPLVLAMHIMIIFIVLISLYICIKKSLSDHSSYILVCTALVLPIVINLLFGGFFYGNLPDIYVWTVSAVVFSMFLVNRNISRLFFKFFVCMLFIGMILEIYLRPDINAANMIEYVSNIFYAGFVVFASLEFYMTRSIANYSVLEDINIQLKETQTQLIQKEQMATLGQLIAGVAHEINTPIGAIKASAETLDRINLGKLLNDISRYNSDDLEALLILLDICKSSAKNMRSTMELRRGKEQMRKYLESVEIPNAGEISNLLARMDICDVEKVADNIDIFRHRNIIFILRQAGSLAPYINSIQIVLFATDKITKMTAALKYFSHMNITGEEHQFDVSKNIDNVLVLYQNQLKNGVEIIKQYDEEIPHLYGNEEETNQVWTNIIQNAIHAMSYVGTLTIRIRNIDFKKVEISFTDTGTGIAAENLEKIFTPFFTTKPLGEGSGLGLDICKKIISKHNGDITATSRPGQGTTFTVTLPVSESTPRGRVAEIVGGI